MRVAEEREEADGSETYFRGAVSRIGHELSWGEARGVKVDSQVCDF